MPELKLIELVNEPGLLAEVKDLLNEYGHYMYDELGLSAGKENFLEQLEQFPGVDYQPPKGTFVVAKWGNAIAGCVGIKILDETSCEMKRLFIRSAYRGKGIGECLCRYVIDWSSVFYRQIFLDTNTEMKEAVSLYRKCGFIEIAPYCINENNNPVFMKCIL